MAKKTTQALVFDKTGPHVSAVGVAEFAYLKRSDGGFEGKAPKNKITIVFDPDSDDYKAMVNTILTFENQFMADNKKPARTVPACVKTHKENGRPTITFTRKAREDGEAGTIPVPVYDAAGNETQQDVWSGDLAKVQFSMAAYKGFGGGVKCYLNCVQLIKSNKEPGKAKVMFKDETSSKQAASTQPLKDEGDLL